MSKETPGFPISEPPSYSRLTLFFLPLVVLTFSQSLTYPLVASIVSHGPLAVHEYDAYVMGQQILFLIGSLGWGLIPTGMMFCTSRGGMRNYLRMNQGIALTSALLQLVVCLPGPDRFVFGHLMGLEGEMLRIARNSLLYCIPLQYNFFVRNPYLAILYNAKRTGLTNYATVLRVALAFVLADLFPRLGWVGHGWGAVAATFPAIVETALTWWFARPYIRKLPQTLPGEAPAPVARQLRYTIPLSAGGTLLTATAFFVSVYFSKTTDPEVFRPVHFLAIGIVNPVLFSALKMQTVTVAFKPSTPASSRRIAAFAAWVGGVLAVVPLLFSAWPAPAHWYFCDCQNLPETSLWMARIVMVIAAAFVPVFAFRGRAEGLAAIRYRTDTIMHSQIAYFAAFVGTLQLCLSTGAVPGYLWGVLAIAAGAVATVVIIHAELALRGPGRDATA